MKTLTYQQYTTLFDALCAFLFSKENACGWMFEQINGRKFGQPSETWGKSKPILTMSQINRIWSNQHVSKGLVKLVIMKHYTGCRVYLTKNSLSVIMNDDVSRYASRLMSKLKLYNKENLDNVC